MTAATVNIDRPTGREWRTVDDISFEYDPSMQGTGDLRDVTLTLKVKVDGQPDRLQIWWPYTQSWHGDAIKPLVLRVVAGTLTLRQCIEQLALLGYDVNHRFTNPLMQRDHPLWYAFERALDQ